MKGLRWLVMFLLLLAVPVMACGISSGEDEEAAPAVPAGELDAAVEASAEEEVAPSESEVVEESGEDQEGATGEEPRPESSDGDGSTAGGPDVSGPIDLPSLGEGLESFDSFRQSIEMEFEELGDSPNIGAVSLQVVSVAEPPASSMTMAFSGAFAEEIGSEGDATLAFAEIGDQSYTLFPGIGCVAGSGEAFGGAAPDFSEVFDTEDVLGEIEEPDFVGEETLDGVPVYHYRFDETDIEDPENEFEQLDGHVYVAKEGEHVVRMVLEGVGEFDFLGDGTKEPGTMSLEYNVFDINEPITVEVPEGCQEGGSEFPIMDGATGIAALEGFTAYEIDANMDDVVAFYMDEMAALGYEVSEQPFTVEGMEILSFVSDDGPPISVTINETDSGLASVLVTREDPDQ